MKVRRGRQGLHLFDRNTGVNILFDEVPVSEAGRHRAPRYVSFAITNACELKCPYCYAPKAPARLCREQIVLWASELAANGCLGIGFGGGEPTAHPEFAEICELVAMSTDLAVGITTHGHRFDSTLAQRLRGHVHFIRVSVDGVDETYERLRGRPFADLRKRIETIASIAPFGFNVVVNEETVGDLDDIYALAELSGASEILLLPEQPVGNHGGISAVAEVALSAWVGGTEGRIPLTISEARIPGGVPSTDPFPSDLPLEEHAHVDAFGMLREHAFASQGIEIGESLIGAVEDLSKGVEVG
jgi:sulfatase maturation enzyme AslB (radical SAM superfamily)